jgi:uncharacterized Zn-binding protein involved in type VI secretion
MDVQGSPDVFVNGYPKHRRTDADAHGGTQVGCSPNVFVNGLGAARVGDAHSGDGLLHPPAPEATGSPDVFIND